MAAQCWNLMKNQKSKIPGRRLFIISCLLLLTIPYFTNAQYCSFVKAIGLNKSSLDNRIACSYEDEKVFFTTQSDWDKDAHVIKFFCCRINDMKMDSFTVIVPSDITIYDLPDISANDQFLILVDDDEMKIHVFTRSGNTYKYKNDLKLPEHIAITEIKALSNNLFLMYSIYNYDKAENLYNSNVCIYDALQDKIVHIIHPEMPCIAFSHLSMQNVAYTSSSVAVSDPCGYKIRLYDRDLSIKDSIEYTAQQWKNYPGNKFPYETNPAIIHPKLLIEKLQQSEDSVSRIERIFFINENQLLVSSKGPGNSRNTRRLDIWTKKHLTNSIEHYPIRYNDTDTLHLNSIPLLLNNNNNTFFADGIMIQVNEENLYPEENETLKHFTERKNIFYEKNDPQYSIAIYKIN